MFIAYSYSNLLNVAEKPLFTGLCKLYHYCITVLQTCQIWKRWERPDLCTRLRLVLPRQKPRCLLNHVLLKTPTIGRSVFYFTTLPGQGKSVWVSVYQKTDLTFPRCLVELSVRLPLISFQPPVSTPFLFRVELNCVVRWAIHTLWFPWTSPRVESQTGAKERSWALYTLLV